MKLTSHEGVDKFQEWVEANGSDEVKDKMMSFIDRAEARGETKGIEKGRAEERTKARKEGLANLIIAFSKKGFPESEIFSQAQALYGKYFSDEEIEQFIEQNTQKIK